MARMIAGTEVLNSVSKLVSPYVRQVSLESIHRAGQMVRIHVHDSGPFGKLNIQHLFLRHISSGQVNIRL